MWYVFYIDVAFDVRYINVTSYSYIARHYQQLWYFILFTILENHSICYIPPN